MAENLPDYASSVLYAFVFRLCRKFCRPNRRLPNHEQTASAMSFVNEGLGATKQMGNPALDNVHEHIVRRLPTNNQRCR